MKQNQYREVIWLSPDDPYWHTCGIVHEGDAKYANVKVLCERLEALKHHHKIENWHDRAINEVLQLLE